MCTTSAEECGEHHHLIEQSDLNGLLHLAYVPCISHVTSYETHRTTAMSPIPSCTRVCEEGGGGGGEGTLKIKYVHNYTHTL